jgi:N-methylhydantoinase A/oxoprolinase/acetone carboxylase beta subunit
LLSALIRESRYGAWLLRRVEQLAAEHLVIRAGFTPTDALHALGHLELWNAEAACLGAQALAAQYRCSVDELCREVVEGVSVRAARAIVSKVLSDEARPPDWEAQPTASLLLERALGDGHSSDLGYALTLRRPLVAIGAPVQAYMPRVAEMLHTRLMIPPHAEVANAVGAVVGGVIQRQQVLITPLDPGGTLRVHLPEAVRDFCDLDEAVADAQQWMIPWMEERARQAGANQVEVHVARRDMEANVRLGWGDRLYLGTELTFTAVGRPSPTREQGSSGPPSRCEG